MAHTLLANLSYTELIGLGITANLGSGGFNLIGKAVNRAGSSFPLALGATGALFMGASKVYEKAWTAFPTNTAESEIVADQFGMTMSHVSEGGILLFNILSISTILVFCSQVIFPKGTWIGQISVAILFLILMSYFALKGIEENKKVTNIFSGTLVLFLTIISFAAVWEGAKDGLALPTRPATNFPLSILYFYFILAGFESLVKFTNEAKDKSDIPKSFYTSNAVSILLVLGVSMAFLHVTAGLRRSDEQNAIGEIIKSIVGGKYTAGVVMGGSVICMIVTTFVCFLTASRFLFGLGERYTSSWWTTVNSAQAPTTAILATGILAAIGILLNQIDFLVVFADICLTITLILVSAAVTKKEIDAGRFPVIEGATLTGLVGLLIMSLGMTRT
jgi:hypothetical protein